jgi:hypothetical protein
MQSRVAGDIPGELNMSPEKLWGIWAQGLSASKQEINHVKKITMCGKQKTKYYMAKISLVEQYQNKSKCQKTDFRSDF